MIWTEKYRPRRADGMVGNELARAQFYRWLRGWTPGTKPALLLGPPGTGKTTVVHAVADELGYDMLELNASDYRTKDVLDRRIRPAMGGVTVFGAKLLVFLDEVDGLYGRADYGGAEYLSGLMSSIRVPLVTAANRDDVGYMPGIEKASLVLQFRRVPARLVELYLRHITKSEGLELGQGVLEDIVRYARGDVRAAVNALEAAAYSGKFEGGYRDVPLDLKDAIGEATGTRSAEAAYAALRPCDAQPQDKLRAAYAALSMSDVKADRRAEAMRALSDSDILYSRIRRTQNWKLLRYFDRILASSLAGTFAMYSEYNAPFQISSRVWNEGRTLARLADIMAKELHMSRGEFMMYCFDAFALEAAEDEDVLKRVAGLLGEDEDVLKRVLSKERARLLGEEVEEEGAARRRSTWKGGGRGRGGHQTSGRPVPSQP